MKKKSKLIAFTIITSVLFTTACGSKDNTVQEVAKTIPVETTAAKTETIKNETSYSAKVKGQSEVNVFAKVPGIVTNINFEIGEKVNKGDILLSVDKRDVELACESAKASLAQAQTSLDLVNGSSMQTTQLNAKIAYEAAKTNYENTKVLYENNVVAKTEFDTVERAYEQAKTAYELSITTIPEENERRAKDGLALAQAQYNSAVQKLADCDVKAPISGVVTAVNAVEGSMMSQTGPAFTIVNTDKINIVVSVSEKLISSLKVGDEADVYIKAVSQIPFTGKIIAVNAGANQAGTFDVKLEIDNPDGKIKSGMFGEVVFTKEENKDALVVPKNAVLENEEGKYVYLSVDGKAKQVQVETGIETGEKIEITSGLKNGDLVITKGQTYINDGDEIEVVSSSKGE